MGSGDLGTTWVIVAIGLFWLVVAAAVSVVAARRFRLAQEVLDAARSSAALLDMTPARPLLVYPDDKVEVDSQLVRDLGLASAPGRLEEELAELNLLSYCRTAVERRARKS